MQALRIARPTDDLDGVGAFYRDGLGLDVLASFAGHDGFDGLVLGRPDLAWHLELVHRHGHPAGPCPDPEHLLAVYHDSPAAHAEAVARVEAAGGRRWTHPNPWWGAHGTVVLDPDGYPLVLVASAWSGA